MEKKKLTLAQRLKKSQSVTKYIKNAYRRWEVKVHKEHDADMVEFLEAKDNVQAYIKELIRRDMEATKN